MLCPCFWAAAKATLKEKKCKAINRFIVKQGRIKINELDLCFKSLADEQQSKPQASWMKMKQIKEDKMTDLRKRNPGYMQGEDSLKL